MNFEELGLHPQLLEGIQAIGFTKATPIQEKAIPAILAGKDIIASAQTGTGKTAAFLVPLTHRIISSPDRGKVKALIIVPTRELATQIDQHMEGIAYFTPVSSAAIYGGNDGLAFSREKQALVEGADMIICTPGRMIAHLSQGYLNTDGLEFLVLDEADRMLDMGFFDDIMRIISYLPAKRQTLLFSATMPPRIRELARKVLNKPEEITIALSRPAEKVLQGAYVLTEQQKPPMVASLLRSEKLKSVLVFCSTKIATRQLSRELTHEGIANKAIHSDLEQADRETIMLSFRNKALRILVATDIVSRGIDVEDIDMVINYDVPVDAEDYIHRIGRTARAESDGIAITLISEKDQRRFAAIEKLLGYQVYKAPLPEQLGPGPEYDPAAQPREKSFRKKTPGGRNDGAAKRGRKPFGNKNKS